jgi:hypothetical protein
MNTKSAMTMNQVTFETWYATICSIVKAATEITFSDEDSVRQDYEDGKDAYAVAQDIVREYQE